MGKCILCNEPITSKEFEAETCWDCEIKSTERKGGYR